MFLNKRLKAPNVQLVFVVKINDDENKIDFCILYNDSAF